MEGTEIQYNLTQTIIIIIVVTLILLLILRLLKYIFPLLPRKERTREWIKKNFVYAESFIWMIYLAIIIPYLHNTNIIFEIIAVSIILIVILLIGYYFGRDFFAGIVFKFAYKIKEGDFIQYKDTVGKVKKLGMQIVVSTVAIVVVVIAVMLTVSVISFRNYNDSIMLERAKVEPRP